MCVQVRIMSHKVEEDYAKRVEVEQSERTKDQLLQALDKIRAPICVCEIVQFGTKILFANHTWTMLAGEGLCRGNLGTQMPCGNKHILGHNLVTAALPCWQQ